MSPATGTVARHLPSGATREICWPNRTAAWPSAATAKPLTLSGGIRSTSGVANCVFVAPAVATPGAGTVGTATGAAAATGFSMARNSASTLCCRPVSSLATTTTASQLAQNGLRATTSRAWPLPGVLGVTIQSVTCRRLSLR